MCGSTPTVRFVTCASWLSASTAGCRRPRNMRPCAYALVFFGALLASAAQKRLLLLLEVFFVLGALSSSDYSPDSEAARKLLWTSLCSTSERRGGPYARGGSEHGVRKVPAHRTVGLAAASTGATTRTRGVIKHYARDTRTPLDGGAAGGGGGSGGPAHRGELHGRALLGQVEIYLRDGRPLPASDPLLIVGDHLARHAELSTAAKQPLLRRGERTIFDLMLELIDQLTQHLDSASPRAVQRPGRFLRNVLAVHRRRGPSSRPGT